MSNNLHRLPQVLQITGLSRSTLYRQVKLGQFPQPVKIGPRAIAWRETDLEKWLKSRQTVAHFSS